MLTRCSIILQFTNWNAQVRPFNLLTNYPPKPTVSKQHRGSWADSSSSVDTVFFFPPSTGHACLWREAFSCVLPRHWGSTRKDKGQVSGKFIRAENLVTSWIILCDYMAFEESHLLLRVTWGHFETKMNAEKPLCKLPNRQKLPEHILSYQALGNGKIQRSFLPFRN